MLKNRLKSVNLKVVNYIFSIFIIVILFIFNESLVLASDIVCNNNDGCSGFEESLFSNMDLKPGDTYNASFCIYNNRSENLEAVFSSKETSDPLLILKKVLEIEINEIGGNVLFAGKLQDFFVSEINIGAINEGVNRCFAITIYCPYDAGNEYQESQVNFDLIVRITGEDSDEEDVLSCSTSTADCESCETSTDIKSILGEVLGLSDTSGYENSIYYILGFALTFFGIILITKGRKKHHRIDF